MYSQNNEERIIVDAVGSLKGKFLDIGAYDGKTFSNTLRLVELGWGGVCVECAPSVLPHLRALHGNNPKIRIEPRAVAKFTGATTFYDSGGDAIGTMDKAHRDRWEAGYKVTYVEHVVDTISVNDLLKQYGRNFEFINIDIEGKNFEIFDRFPWELMNKARCVCVEHDGKLAQIVTRIRKHGFAVKLVNAENVILCR